MWRKSNRSLSKQCGSHGDFPLFIRFTVRSSLL